jgi:hypothetical protein
MTFEDFFLRMAQACAGLAAALFVWAAARFAWMAMTTGPP